MADPKTTQDAGATNDQSSRDADALMAMDSGEEYLSAAVGDQILGLPVNQVNDILDPQSLTWVAGAPSAVRGLVNLRGHIVTAIDLRKRLAVAEPLSADHLMHVVVSTEDNELYSLAVDNVTEIRSLDEDKREPVPPTLARAWQDVTEGVFRIQQDGRTVLMLAVDIPSIIDFEAIRGRVG